MHKSFNNYTGPFLKDYTFYCGGVPCNSSDLSIGTKTVIEFVKGSIVQSMFFLKLMDECSLIQRVFYTLKDQRIYN